MNYNSFNEINNNTVVGIKVDNYTFSVDDNYIISEQCSKKYLNRINKILAPNRRNVRTDTLDERNIVFVTDIN